MIYTFVARSFETVLVSYQDEKSSYSNAPQYSRNMLKSISKIPNLSLTPQDNPQFTFHFVNDRTFTFLVVTQATFKPRIAFAYLMDIKNKFFSGEIPDHLKFGKEGCLNSTFYYNYIKEKFLHHSDVQNDNLYKLEFEVKVIKGLMIDNIDKMLDRGEKLENLIEKTHQMKFQAVTMKGGATRLKRTFWWKNWKLNIIIFLVVLLLIYIILGIICGFAFQKC